MGKVNQSILLGISGRMSGFSGSGDTERAELTVDENVRSKSCLVQLVRLNHYLAAQLRGSSKLC